MTTSDFPHIEEIVKHRATLLCCNKAFSVILQSLPFTAKGEALDGGFKPGDRFGFWGPDHTGLGGTSHSRAAAMAALLC